MQGGARDGLDHFLILRRPVSCGLQQHFQTFEWPYPGHGFSETGLAYACQTISPPTMVATGPPTNVLPSNGELLLLDGDFLTS
jgi:hypothetical protein